MLSVWVYTIVSLLIVSLISFIGVLSLAVKVKNLGRWTTLLVSFAVGVLFGDVFIHLLPEITKDGFTQKSSFMILVGILIFFVIEKIVHWHHSHKGTEHTLIKPIAIMNLVGDGIHNFLDGVLVGVSYLVSIPLGIATTLAVIFHEIPQEVSDFGILVYSGLRIKKALLFNFFSAITAVVGGALAIIIGTKLQGFTDSLIPIAIGGFIYIAGSDLMPELHKETKIRDMAKQLLAIVLGIGVMYALLILE